MFESNNVGLKIIYDNAWDFKIEGKEVDEFSQYIESLEKDGYIDKNGRPLKCMSCMGKEFDMVDIYYENEQIVEYAYKCESCGEIVGHWGYGSWGII